MSGPNGAGHTGHDTSPRNRFAIIPEHAAANPYLPATVRVLIALGVACRERWTGADRIVEASLNDLAAIAHVDRRNVRRATRWLQAAGLIRIEEPTTAANGGFEPTRYVLIGGGVVTGDDRGVVTDDDRVSANMTTRQKEEKELEKPPPPLAREGGEGSLHDRDRRQGELLMPITGGGDRKARLAVIDNYEPSPAVVEWAARLGVVDARADNVFGKWKSRRIADNRLPLDHRGAEEDFKNWIRDQPGYDERERARAVSSGSPRQPRAPRRDAMAEILARVQAAQMAEAAE